MCHNGQQNDVVYQMLRKVSFLLSCLSLLVGGGIYLLFRPESLVMFQWVNKLGFYSELLFLRKQSAVFAVNLPSWLIFSAPNGLWTFSFSALMVAIWGGKNFAIIFYWTASLWLVGVFTEFLQYLGVIGGVFDLYDIVAYTIGAVLVLFFIKRDVNL